MRRVMFTVVATVLLAGAVPAGALAHHHKHHARHHAGIRRFGDQNTQPTSTSSADNAGTVQSFQNGVLTIALNDGSTVKGMVTNDTELECTSAQSSSTHDSGDGGSGDQSSGGDSQSSGSDSQSSGSGDQGDNDQNETQGEDQNQTQGSDQGDDQGDGQSSSCSTSSLTPGAVVHEASLRIGGSGAMWQKVELVS